jgi:hypothetical protein
MTRLSLEAIVVEPQSLDRGTKISAPDGGRSATIIEMGHAGGLAP